MPYFDEPVGRVKIQTSNVYMFVRPNFADIYLRAMRDRSMRSGTEFASPNFRLLCCVAVSIFFNK